MAISLPRPSSSDVFCQGELLKTVQLAGVFEDSKEFVDRPLRADPEAVLEAFHRLPDNSSATLREFVFNWTDNAATDIV